MPNFHARERLLLPLHCERFRALRRGSFAHAHDRNCVRNIGGAAWLTIKHWGATAPRAPPPGSDTYVPLYPPTFTLYVFLCRAFTRECTTLATPGSHLVRWWGGISGSVYVGFFTSVKLKHCVTVVDKRSEAHQVVSTGRFFICDGRCNVAHEF